MSRLFDDALGDVRRMSMATSLGRFNHFFERFSETFLKATEDDSLSEQDFALLDELAEVVQVAIDDAVDSLGDRMQGILDNFSGFIQSSGSRHRSVHEF